jgi:hypothetical protein
VGEKARAAAVDGVLQPPTAAACNSTASCELKPGQPPVYKTICVARKTEALCLALNITCDWLVYSCHAKPGQPAPYGPICKEQATEATVRIFITNADIMFCRPRHPQTEPHSPWCVVCSALP